MTNWIETLVLLRAMEMDAIRLKKLYQHHCHAIMWEIDSDAEVGATWEQFIQAIDTLPASE